MIAKNSVKIHDYIAHYNTLFVHRDNWLEKKKIIPQRRFLTAKITKRRLTNRGVNLASVVASRASRAAPRQTVAIGTLIISIVSALAA